MAKFKVTIVAEVSSKLSLAELEEDIHVYCVKGCDDKLDYKSIEFLEIEELDYPDVDLTKI